MSQTLRFLLLEDNQADSELLLRALKKSEFNLVYDRVDNEADFIAHLDPSLDVIISDFQLPSFTGLQALEIVRKSDLKIPFILVSGTIGEEIAVEAIRQGAADYLLKDRLTRLGEAIHRVLEESRLRKEREAAETSFRKSEERFRQVVENIGEVFWMTDIEKNLMVYVSPGYERIWGRSVASLYESPQTWVEAIHPLDRDRVSQSALKQSTETYDVEYRIIRPDGAVLWIRDRAFPVKNKDGEIYRMAGVATDITDQKRAQKNLLEREIELGEAQRIAEIGSWEADLSSGDSIWSAEQYRLLGLHPNSESLTFDSYLEILHPEDRERLKSIAWKAIEDRGSFDLDHRIIRPDGQVRWMHGRAEAILDESGNVVRMRGTNQDITERKQAESALHMFRTLIDQSNDAFEVIDPKTGRFLDVNQRGCQELGYTRKEFLDLTIFDVDPMVEQLSFAKNIEKLRKAGVLTWEGFHKRKDNSIFPVEVNLKYVQIDRDYVVGVVRNITERKQAEKRLRLQSSALEAAANAILITGHDGIIESVNAAFTRTTGYSVDEAIGKRPGDLLNSGKHDKTFFRNMWETILAGKIWNGEMQNRKKDGSLYSEEMTITPLINESGIITQFVAIKQDISLRKQAEAIEKERAYELEKAYENLKRETMERTKLEEQLRQAQKMEAIGRLSGGIAHDFNNLLTVILGHVAVIEMGEISADVQESVEEIKHAGERAANLTRQLLLFARRQTMELRPIDLNSTITETIKMLQRIVGEDIHLEFRPATGSLKVNADAGMLDQVLMNLAVNARDAMPGGGSLVIETATIEFDEETAMHSNQIRAGSFVSLSVSDSGVGIPADVLPKIFDPFFTTKEIGKGTGLGLSTAFGIVQEHGGWINVYSEIGRGSTFRIYLPMTKDASESRSPGKENKGIPGGTETILLAEDEVSIRGMLVKYLTRLGYDVLSAGSGPEAVKIFQEQKSKISLLITDIVMPGGMSGVELSRMLNSEKPEMKVIYMSGYSDMIAAGELLLQDGVNFLAKPFALPNVAAIVRLQLDSGKK